MSTLPRAIQIASAAHAGQRRKNGSPYILHPIRVMLAQDSTEGMILGVLHDVIEDTPTTLDDLRQCGFDAILSALALLTHTDDIPYEEYIQRIGRHALASRVKLADLEDNMDVKQLPSVQEGDLRRTSKYHKAWVTLRSIMQEDAS